MARANSFDTDLFDRGIAVRLDGLSAGYGAHTVLSGLDFEARKGEVALVTGPEAAGKSTLMHLLRLTLAPRAGRAVILGLDIGRSNAGQRAKLKRRIGYVAENPVFVEHLTALENIILPLKMARRRARAYERDVIELVDFVGLDRGGADLPVENISGAERRRAAIARALASKPDLILADDPTAGMSPEEGRRIVKRLAEMRRVGAAVVITSQDESLADVAPMQHWRIARGRLAIDHASSADAEAFE
ncbi:MAG: ATP-binding cassette domain-containing protein [Terricaulis sp.]|nr:ATP-binding cassette domain-containing protein [Terricaulis sp.]